MKNALVFLFVFLLNLSINAQIKFENGYIINNSNEKISCLIKNKDWRDNPSKFEYKLSENAEVQVGNLTNIKEFGIDNKFKYQRKIVKIDRSNDIHNLSKTKAPEFSEETLFLSVLFEGPTNLYVYKQGNLKRFFVSRNNNIEQLIYKKYLVKDNLISYNLEYKQQLWKYFKCSNSNMMFYEKVDYNKSDLINFLISYSKCLNKSFVVIKNNKKKYKFNFSIRPGIKTSSLSIKNSNVQIDNVSFERELGFRLGAEAEFVFPFNKNKWSVLVEPTYQYYKSEGQFLMESLLDDYYVNFDIDYKSIEVPLGVRHYMFLNKSSKLFINTAVIYDFSFNSTVDVDYNGNREPFNEDIDSKLSFAFGAGYKFKDKLSIEVRYHTAREILNKYTYWTSDYKTTSLILGYNLF